MQCPPLSPSHILLSLFSLFYLLSLFLSHSFSILINQGLSADPYFSSQLWFKVCMFFDFFSK